MCLDAQNDVYFGSVAVRAWRYSHEIWRIMAIEIMIENTGSHRRYGVRFDPDVANNEYTIAPKKMRFMISNIIPTVTFCPGDAMEKTT
jgi:hypothetical protein